jgi:prevent-host-death family protein
MATKTVGVRELKEQAPRLVQRVERGERIVITRHGRAAAMLVPVSEDPAVSRQRPRLARWAEERRAFEAMIPDLDAHLHGKFVAVAQGKVIDSHADPDVLFQRVAKRLGDETFFIGRVGESEPVVEMPGFSLE